MISLPSTRLRANSFLTAPSPQWTAAGLRISHRYARTYSQQTGQGWQQSIRLRCRGIFSTDGTGYDLEDILVQAGTSEKELADFRDALKDCVLCNYATPKFITITIRTHCGLSMYLPCNGEAKLDTYYRTLDWNLATELVE